MELKPGSDTYTINIKNCGVNFYCRYNPASEDVILFLHGLACSSDSFRNVHDANYFPGKSLLIVDLPGFGESGKPESFSYRMEDQADILENLLLTLPPWKIHIAAHSMSGAIALLFSPQLYSRIVSFSNIEGNLISEDCGLLSRGIADVLYEQYKNEIYNWHLSEFKKHHQLRFNETTPFAVYNSAASLVQWSDSGKLLEKFSSITCRKCYFYGEENINMEVLKRLDFVPKFMISKSGHGMMTENPEEFYSKLANFINQ
jgi:pimeloyl-ACP methyl ester carboxylesterase